MKNITHTQNIYSCGRIEVENKVDKTEKHETPIFSEKNILGYFKYIRKHNSSKNGLLSFKNHFLSNKFRENISCQIFIQYRPLYATGGYSFLQAFFSETFFYVVHISFFLPNESHL